MITFRCQSCGATLQADHSAAWSPMECPKCGVTSTVPDRVGAPAPHKVLCKNHPDVEAIDRCTACAEPFCPNCLVDLHGEKYCGSCKVMAVQGKSPAVAPTIPCKEADEALKYAIIGIFCFGIILEPIAISRALKAKKMMSFNPTLSGSGKATAALVIAIASLGLWILGLIARFAKL